MLEVKFKTDDPDLVLVESINTDGGAIIIYRHIKDSQFYARGPFGKEKQVCFISLGSDLSTESKQALLSGWRRQNLDK